MEVSKASTANNLLQFTLLKTHNLKVFISAFCSHRTRIICKIPTSFPWKKLKKDWNSPRLQSRFSLIGRNYPDTSLYTNSDTRLLPLYPRLRFASNISKLATLAPTARVARDVLCAARKTSYGDGMPLR